LNRTLLARRLERLGHAVGQAANGREALALLAAEPFDLVLLDIMMPELDGYEVLRRLKAHERLRDIPVIVISALDELASAVRCIELGAEDYLPKPFDPVLLRARIGAGLEKKRLRDQEVAYLEHVARLTEAAAAVEAGAFDAALLGDVAARSDPLGRLARVFQAMAREVQAREQRLRQQVQELTIEIDRARGAKQVAEITETEYFRSLQERAKSLRSRSR
jgi:two-component system, cell cycle response regulator